MQDFFIFENPNLCPMNDTKSETPDRQSKKQGFVENVLRFVFDKYTLAFSGLIALLVFQKELVYKLNFFDKISPSKEADLIFLVAIVLIFLRYSELVFIRKYIFSRNYERFIVGIGLMYLIFRFVLKDYWIYTPLDCSNFNGLVYSDFIMIVLFFHTVFEFGPRIFKSCFGAKLKTVDPSNSIFKIEHEDDNSNDSYGRTNLASLVAKEVYKLKSDRSIAVGVTGPWGTGKTWFMNKIKDEILEIDSTVKVLKFNSWLPDSDNGITKAFFKMLKAELTTVNGNLGADIDKYIKSISNLDKSNFTSGITDFFQTNRTLKNELDDIAKVIGQTTERIIIIIDDLDRLNENELSEVLQILRSTEEFKNVIFFVGYDKQYITTAISKINEHKHTQYLEKIFQIEITLPIIPNKTLFDGFVDSVITVLNKKMDDRVAKNYFIKELKSFFEVDSKSNFGNAYELLQQQIISKRELVIFRNNILLSLIYLKEERISIRDLLLIELLRIKFFEQYEALKIDRFSLLEIDGESNYRFIGNEEAINKSCLAILDELFNNRTDRGISDVINFDLYFYAKSSIPFYSFYDLLKGDLTELTTQVDKWILDNKEDALISLIERTQHFDNKWEYTNLLEMCLYLIEKGIKYDNNILVKLFDLEIIDSVLPLYKDNRDSMFEDLLFVLRRHPKINLIGVMVNKLIDTGYSEFIKRVAIGLLRNNIEQNEDYLVIEKNFISCKGKLLDGKYTQDVGAMSMFKEYILRYPNLFVKHAIKNYDQTLPEFETQTLFPFTEQVFGNYSEFESLINKWENSPELSELRTFFRRFKSNNFNPIRFERGTIEFVSDSNNQFIKSDFFHKSGPAGPASIFTHPSWHKSVVKIDKNFNGVTWIAKEQEIVNMDEVQKGDCYYFKRIVDLAILEHRSIKTARIKFMVDDVLSIKLNGKFICEDVITSDTKVETVDIDTKALSRDNVFEFNVKNNEGALAKLPSDNPYGLIYILEINFDTSISEDENKPVEFI